MVIRFFLMVVVLLASATHAELVIEVTQGKQSAIPISVVSFKWEGLEPLPEDVSRIVRNDLASSGYFTLLNPRFMINQPVEPEDIVFSEWQRMRQDYVVTGKVSPVEGGYAIEFHVMDVHNQLHMFHHRVKGKSTQLRDISHYISDYIFKRLTGIPGVFSTKLIYVTTNQQRTSFNLNFSDADGAREQLIFRSSNPILSPAWYPDGRKVAYVSFENGQSEIFIQNLSTGERKKAIPMRGANSAPSISPDGKKMAFVHSKLANPDIYLMDLETSKIKRITTHYGIDTEPQWMSDSRHILFTSSRAGKPQIYKVDTTNGVVERVTFEGSYNARPRLTLDDKKMVYVHGNGNSFHIAVLDLITNKQRVLTYNTNLDESPSVAPNGSMIVYAASEGDRSILAAVSIDGAAQFRLPSKFGDVREPAWSPLMK